MLKKVNLNILLVFSLVMTICFIGQAQRSLPLNIDCDVKRAAYQLQDSLLEATLKMEINKRPAWRQLINQQRMAVGVIDLGDLCNIRYAGINDDLMLYAASLPKIAILLSAMDAFEEGELEQTPEIMRDLNLMIRRSNNQASTRMIDRLGYDKIESVLRGKQQLYDENVGGGLWVGKRYAAGGNRNPEPMKGLTHAATVSQVCNFYYQLVIGNLINYDRSAEMLKIMKNPALHHKFVNTLDRIAPKATLYRKSGSWKNFHSDSILVWGTQRAYILVALIHDSAGEQIIRDLVLPVEKVMKKTRSCEN